MCGEKDITLNVHHLRYAASGDPWDVHDEWLESLCDECHESMHSGRKEAEKRLLWNLARRHYTDEDIDNLSTALESTFDTFSDEGLREAYSEAEELAFAIDDGFGIVCAGYEIQYETSKREYEYHKQREAKRDAKD